MLLAAKSFGLNKPNHSDKRTKRLQSTYEWLDSIILGIVVVFFVFTFILGSFSVEGDSMLPTFHDRDRLFLLPPYTAPNRGDIVVFEKTAFGDTEDTSLIKRVIGVEGDVVDIDFDLGLVYVNGEALEEPYTAEPIHRQGTNPIEFPLEIGTGMVFVLGDNRNDSKDSRDATVGQVDTRYIRGKVLARFWPVDHFTFFLGGQNTNA